MFSVYLLSRVDIIIRYIEVDFTFESPDYVCFIEEFVVSRLATSRFYSILWPQHRISFVISRTLLNKSSFSRGSTVKKEGNLP